MQKQNGELFDTQISAEEYNYDSISEDSEFAKCAADYNQAFLDIDQLNEIMTDFEDFSKGQRLLYLMFAYESYTIDEIEDLLEIDSTFIGTQIMQIRGMLGLDMVSLDGDGPQVHVADEDSSEDETDDEDSSDDSVPEIDFDDNDNYSDRYDAKSANHGIKADARMRGIIAICAALVVVLAVATVAIAGRIKKISQRAHLIRHLLQQLPKRLQLRSHQKIIMQQQRRQRRQQLKQQRLMSRQRMRQLEERRLKRMILRLPEIMRIIIHLTMEIPKTVETPEQVTAEAQMEAVQAIVET